MLPLLATQILWLNLVTDGAPALALGVDPLDSDLMSHSPRPRLEGVITGRMRAGIGLVGVVMAARAPCWCSTRRCPAGGSRARERSPTAGRWRLPRRCCHSFSMPSMPGPRRERRRRHVPKPQALGRRLLAGRIALIGSLRSLLAIRLRHRGVDRHGLGSLFGGIESRAVVRGTGEDAFRHSLPGCEADSAGGRRLTEYGHARGEPATISPNRSGNNSYPYAWSVNCPDRG